MTDSRLWFFVADMNSSGSVTISDVWLWFKWLYFYPGDGFIYLLIHEFPDVGKFLELTYSSYQGLLSGVLSLLLWPVIILFLFMIFMGPYNWVVDAEVITEEDKRD